MQFFASFCVCAVFALASVYSLTEQQTEILNKVKADCLNESKVNPVIIEKLKKGDWEIDNAPLKQFALCVLVKTELMSPEGVFHVDEALTRVPEEDRDAVGAIIEGCLDDKFGENPALVAWRYLKCYHSKNPKHPIM